MGVFSKEKKIEYPLPVGITLKERLRRRKRKKQAHKQRMKQRKANT